jgi:hypothetical protein
VKLFFAARFVSSISQLLCNFAKEYRQDAGQLVRAHRQSAEEQKLYTSSKESPMGVIYN